MPARRIKTSARKDRGLLSTGSPTSPSIVGSVERPMRSTPDTFEGSSAIACAAPAARPRCCSPRDREPVSRSLAGLVPPPSRKPLGDAIRLGKRRRPGRRLRGAGPASPITADILEEIPLRPPKALCEPSSSPPTQCRQSCAMMPRIACCAFRGSRATRRGKRGRGTAGYRMRPGTCFPEKCRHQGACAAQATGLPRCPTIPACAFARRFARRAFFSAELGGATRIFAPAMEKSKRELQKRGGRRRPKTAAGRLRLRPRSSPGPTGHRRSSRGAACMAPVIAAAAARKGFGY